MNAHVRPRSNAEVPGSIPSGLRPRARPTAHRLVCRARRVARPFSNFLYRPPSHSRHGGARHQPQGVPRSPQRPRTTSYPGHGGGERSRGLVGPHLPPVVTGDGRSTRRSYERTPRRRAEDAPTLREEDSARATDQTLAEKAKSLIVDGNVRSGQAIVHPQGDVTIIGRVASGAEIVAGGSVHVYGALQGRVIAGISGSRSARIFCTEARAGTALYRRRLCHGGKHQLRDGGPQCRGPAGG